MPNPKEAQRLQNVGFMSNSRVTRREFIHIVLTGLVAGPHTIAATRLRVHLALPPARTDLIQGALLGVHEAQRAAALMSATVDVIRHDRLDDLDAALADSTLGGLIGGHDRRSTEELARRSRDRVPVMNVGATADELRANSCHDSIFHIAPSNAMVAHAAREARVPGSRIATWHPTLFRYGAEQLNDRFRARYAGTPGMSADAWCAWMAVKIVSEAALRSRAATSRELIAWMSSPRARFDGHKGEALTFDARRQLRQPLYAVGADGKVLAELASAPEETEACA